MSDFKESVHDMLIVVLCIILLMVLVYFQQSREWNRALETRDQKISDLDQKIADQQQNLARAQETIAGHVASSQNAAKEIQTARQVIGELETRKLDNEKEIATLKAVLKEKDNEIAIINANLSTIKASSGKDMAASKARGIELENTVTDQARQLTEARATIQRLESSERQLQGRLLAAETALAELNNKHQKVLDELATLKKEN